MTPQEKSKEIYDLMKGFRVKNSHRKKCAIVAVDEILKQLNTMRDKFNETEMLSCGNHTLGKIEYWNDVKSEIEKL